MIAAVAMGGIGFLGQHVSALVTVLLLLVVGLSQVAFELTQGFRARSGE